MKSICRIISVVSALLMLGLAGGVSNGEPIMNLVWCAPLLLLAYVTARIGGSDK